MPVSRGGQTSGDSGRGYGVGFGSEWVAPFEVEGILWFALGILHGTGYNK